MIRTESTASSSDWLSKLRRKLVTLLISLGIPDLDASALQHDIENWALFEPAELTSRLENSIQPDDPDLLEALRLFDLAIG